MYLVAAGDLENDRQSTCPRSAVFPPCPARIYPSIHPPVVLLSIIMALSLMHLCCELLVGLFKVVFNLAIDFIFLGYLFPDVVRCCIQSLHDVESELTQA